MVPSVTVRPAGVADAAWVARTLEQAWGSVQVARKGVLVDASTLPALVAEVGGDRRGLAVYAVRGDECEVVSLSVEVEGLGTGRALLDACVDQARAGACRRVWVVTTNDNVRALGFYQRFGLDLCALHRNAVATSRLLKPSIPLRGEGGVPVAHELELELLLG